MRRLFRSCERFGVEYLLISGQATVLYGAATFSEDVDLWLRPSPGNARRLLRALAACDARVHKLTPPLAPRFMRAGHGFHFHVARADDLYLDVMASPPRVGMFREAARRSVVMNTPWGRIPVVGIEDLVELKKTRRLFDYEVITNLARIRLLSEPSPSAALLRWAARNSFRAEQRASLLGELGVDTTVDECRKRIAVELVRLQKRDTRYWSRRLAERRRLRRQGLLIPQGTPARDLVR